MYFSILLIDNGMFKCFKAGSISGFSVFIYLLWFFFWPKKPLNHIFNWFPLVYSTRHRNVTHLLNISWLYMKVQSFVLSFRSLSEPFGHHELIYLFWYNLSQILDFIFTKYFDIVKHYCSHDIPSFSAI